MCVGRMSIRGRTDLVRVLVFKPVMNLSGYYMESNITK